MAKCECCGQELPKPVSQRFQEFKAIYPRRKDFPNAERTWKRLKLDKIADQILFHVKQSIAKDATWKAGYIPLPTTYLNGKRWEDEVEEETKETFKWPNTDAEWLALGKKYDKAPGIGQSWPDFKKVVMGMVGR